MTALVLLLSVTVFGMTRLTSALLRLAVRHPAIVAVVVLVIDASDLRPTWASLGAAAVVAVALARRRPRHNGRGQSPRLADTHATTLYRFYSPAGALLYVGISNDAFRRIRQHQQAGRIGGDWTMMAQRFEDRPSAEQAERHAIRTERPALNIAHRVS